MAPERLLERLVAAVQALRNPQKEQRNNVLQVGLALLAGVAVAAGQWRLNPLPARRYLSMIREPTAREQFANCVGRQSRSDA